jgi:transcriptional regulator with XRE-family HTH domain
MQGTDYRRRLGNKIRKLRSSRSWSQEEFADLCAVNRSYMGRIERGELNLTLETLQKLANGLGITVAALLKGII